MSSIDNPAEPQSQGGLFNRDSTNTSNNTTDQQSQGGLFSDTSGVGIDLSGITGEQGPPGPQGNPGMDGTNGMDGNTVSIQNYSGNTGLGEDNTFDVVVTNPNTGGVVSRTTVQVNAGNAGTTGEPASIQINIAEPTTRADGSQLIRGDIWINTSGTGAPVIEIYDGFNYSPISADNITVTTTSVSDGVNTFDKYTDLEAQAALNIVENPSGTLNYTDATGNRQTFQGGGFRLDYLTASSIPTIPQDLVAGQAYHIRVTNLTDTDLPTANRLTIDSNVIAAGELDISRGVESGDTNYFTWTPTQQTINIITNNFGSRAALDIVLRFGTVEVTINDDVIDRLENNTTYNLNATASTTTNAVNVSLTGSDMSTDDVTLIGADGITVTRAGNDITLDGRTYALPLTADGLNANLTLASSDPTGSTVFGIDAGRNISLDVDAVNNTLTINAAQGGPTPHAQLRTGFGLSPNRFTTGGTNDQIVGTPTATISDAMTGDQINSISISSAHATLRNETIVINNAGTNHFFTWEALAGDSPATVTFTCVFTVNYTIDGDTMDHSFTMNANLTIRDPIPSYYTGQISQTAFDAIAGTAFSGIINLTGVATVQDTTFSLPFTHDYTGTANVNTYPLVMFPAADGTITDISSQGLVFTDILSRLNIANPDGIDYNLYVSRDPLSRGTHTLTWRS